MFCQLKKEKIKLSVAHPLHAICCCAAVQATCRKQQTPQLWMEGRWRRRGVDCFVLWSHPIWGQGLNNFVSDCTSTNQTISQQSHMQWLYDAELLWFSLFHAPSQHCRKNNVFSDVVTTPSHDFFQSEAVWPILLCSNIDVTTIIFIFIRMCEESTLTLLSFLTMIN